MPVYYRPANVYGNRVIAGMNYGENVAQPVTLGYGYAPPAPAYPLPNNIYYGPGVPVAQQWGQASPQATTVYADYGVQQGGQQVYNAAPTPVPTQITQTAKQAVPTQITQTAKQAVPTQITQTAKQAVSPSQQRQTKDLVNAPGYGVNAVPQQRQTKDLVNAPGYGVNAVPQPVQLPQNLNIDPYGMAPAPQPVQLPQNLNIDPYGMAPVHQPVQFPQIFYVDPYGIVPAPQPVQLPQNLNVNPYGMPLTPQPVQPPQNLNVNPMAPLPRVEDELERLPTANNIPREQLTIEPGENRRILYRDDGRQYMVKTRIRQNPVTGENEEVPDEGALINVPFDLAERILARILYPNSENSSSSVQETSNRSNYDESTQVALDIANDFAANSPVDVIVREPSRRATGESGKSLGEEIAEDIVNEYNNLLPSQRPGTPEAEAWNQRIQNEARIRMVEEFVRDFTLRNGRGPTRDEIMREYPIWARERAQ